jgi:hypothetical protein
VSTSGDAYCPLLIAPRPNAIKLFEKSMRESIDLKLEIRQIPYLYSELFARYIRETFLSIAAANRELSGCANKPALLFCDNCAAHFSNDIVRELARSGVSLLRYPWHTSYIFQVLDVLLFGRLNVLKNIFPMITMRIAKSIISSEYSEHMRT